MKKWVFPATAQGRLSVLAAALFFPVFFIAQAIVIVPDEIPDSPSFFNEPVTASLMILAWLLGTAAAVLGLFAAVKRRERAVTVFLAVLLGLFVFLFGAGEALVPH